MYETYYNLRAKPFQLSPDPRFFYNSQGHKRALAYLRYGVKQGEGFIIVTGNVGTGKTTLVGTLFKSLEQQNVVAAQIVTTQLQADDLLRMVAAAFGLAYQRIAKATLLNNLQTYFRSCVQEGKRVLLVVDEAQNLPKRSIEELRMLSNFQLDGRALLQSFLLGQREFRTTMRSEGFEQLRQRVIAAYHLKPLRLDETRGYVEHRLLTAGWQGDPKITDEAYEGIYHFTEGVPRRINTLCDRLLLFGCLEELHTIDAEALRSVAHDIAEEHGTADEVEADEVKADPSLVTRRGAAMSSAPSPAPALSTVTAENERHNDQQEERMKSMETSMMALASVMKEELSLLRKAMVDGKDGKDDTGE